MSSAITVGTTPTEGLTKVAETADDAAVSKLSAARKGYINDPFLSYFVRKPLNRSPLINRGYYSRMRAIDLIQRRFVAIASRTGDGASQIVSLGAGFDTSFFRSRAEESGVGHATTYFEVDFPEVTARKAAIFRKHPLLQRLIAGQRVPHADIVPLGGSSGRGEREAPALGAASSEHSSPAAAPAAIPGLQFSTTATGGCSVRSSGYRMVTADLRDVAAVRSALNGAGFDPSVPTLFLSECVLVYLEPEESCSIIAWASGACPRSVFVTYEQIRPHDAFGQVMMRNLEERGYSLRGLTAFPDLTSQTARYRELGFNHSTVADMNDVYYRILPRGDVARVERLEMFDEVEEWHLMSAHYCIAVAVNELPLSSVTQRTPGGAHSSAAAGAVPHPPDSPARLIVTDMPAPPPKSARPSTAGDGPGGPGPRSRAGSVASATTSSSSLLGGLHAASSASAHGGQGGGSAPHAALSPVELAVAVVAAHEQSEMAGSHGHGHGAQRSVSGRSASGASAGVSLGGAVGSLGAGAAPGPLLSSSSSSLQEASASFSAASYSAGNSPGGPPHRVGSYSSRMRSSSRSRSVAGSETEMEIAAAVESASGTVVEGMHMELATPSPSPRLTLAAAAGGAAGEEGGAAGQGSHPPPQQSSSLLQSHSSLRGRGLSSPGASSLSGSVSGSASAQPTVIYTHGGDVHIRSRPDHPLDFGAIAEAEEELNAARHLRGSVQRAASAGAAAAAAAGASGAAGSAAAAAARAATTHYDAASISEARRPVSLVDMLFPLEQWGPTDPHGHALHSAAAVGASPARPGVAPLSRVSSFA